MKKKKKGSSLKGLILLIVIFALIGIFFYWYFTKSNICVMVNVYKNSQMLQGAEVSIDGKKAITQFDGMAKLHVRVDQGDTLIVTAEKGELKRSEILVIDEERYITGYTNADIVIDKIKLFPYYYPFGKIE